MGTMNKFVWEISILVLRTQFVFCTSSKKGLKIGPRVFDIRKISFFLFSKVEDHSRLEQGKKGNERGRARGRKGASERQRERSH